MTLKVRTRIPSVLRTEVHAALVAISPQLSVRLQKLQARALRKVLINSEWLTSSELRQRGSNCPGESYDLELWRSDRRIFSLHYQGQDLYPRYALDDNYRPLPIMCSLLRKFGLTDPWRIAVWFESSNGWLEHQSPRRRLRSDPVSVLRALHYLDHAAHG